MFYTALYHSLLHPNVISDTNGQYPGFDGKYTRVDSGHGAAYANYSGWDIYRSQAQLEALVDPAAASDTAQSMVDDYAQTGMFPKWSEDNGETYVMVGDPADGIIADYYAFGARNFDTAHRADRHGRARRRNSNNIRPGLNYLARARLHAARRFATAAATSTDPVSTTLEYNTADFALSAFAGALGNGSDQATFANRAQDWRNVLDPEQRLRPAARRQRHLGPAASTRPAATTSSRPTRGSTPAWCPSTWPGWPRPRAATPP